MSEEFKTEYNIMKRIIKDNGLLEILLNDDEFIKHLNTDYENNLELHYNTIDSSLVNILSSIESIKKITKYSKSKSKKNKNKNITYFC